MHHRDCDPLSLCLHAREHLEPDDVAPAHDEHGRAPQPSGRIALCDSSRETTECLPSERRGRAPRRRRSRSDSGKTSGQTDRSLTRRTAGQTPGRRYPPPSGTEHRSAGLACASTWRPGDQSRDCDCKADRRIGPCERPDMRHCQGEEHRREQRGEYRFERHGLLSHGSVSGVSAVTCPRVLRRNEAFPALQPAINGR